MPSIETRTPQDARAALEDALERQCLVSVYASEDADRFSVGYVGALTDAHVRLLAIDETGRRNGIEIRALSTVHLVETGDDYLVHRLAPLVAHWRKLSNCGPLWPDKWLAGEAGDILMDTLTLSLEDGSVVTAYMADGRQYTGPVVKLSDDAGTIVDLDEFGRPDGEIPFRMADIEGVDFGCTHQRIAQILMRRE